MTTPSRPRYKPSWHKPWGRVFAASLLLAGATTLAGCSSYMLVDNLPAAAGGLPENAPARPATPPPFPAVHDRPPARAVAPLNEAERKRLKEDLATMRDRAARRATSTEPAATDSTPATGSDANP